MNFFDVNHFFPASAFAAGSGLFTSRPLLKRPVLPGGLLVDTAHQYAHLSPQAVTANLWRLRPTLGGWRPD